MQVASILSDLTSLRVCDHTAALALVSVHQAAKANGKSVAEEQGQDSDPDMQRATDLVELHYGVKTKHLQGEDVSLRLARDDVDGVLRKLEGRNIGRKNAG